MIILVKDCDNWHSHASMDLLAVCDDFDMVKKVLNEHTKKHKIPSLTDEDFESLESSLQTQGYEGEGEFNLEIFQDGDMNKLL